MKYASKISVVYYFNLGTNFSYYCDFFGGDSATMLSLHVTVSPRPLIYQQPTLDYTRTYFD